MNRKHSFPKPTEVSKMIMRFGNMICSSFGFLLTSGNTMQNEIM